MKKSDGVWSHVVRLVETLSGAWECMKAHMWMFLAELSRSVGDLHNAISCVVIGGQR